MADRSGAAIFSKIFIMLAENPEANKALAKRIFEITNDCDFNPCQIETPDELLALGVARWGINTDYPGEGVVVLYPGDSGYEDAAK